MLVAMVLATSFVAADVKEWKLADAMCQPPVTDERACEKRADLGVILEKDGLIARAYPSNGPYWEVKWEDK